MSFVSLFFWCLDTFGLTLGLVLELMLITVVINFSGGKNSVMELYGRMVVVIAMQDAMFCFYELNVQHILCFSNGKMFVNAFGWERFIPESFLPLAFFFHVFFIFNTFTFLPAIYSYRYEYLKNSVLGWTGLFGRVGLAMSFSALCSTAGYLAIEKSVARGRDFYLEQLPKAWTDEHGGTNFIYALDLDDIEGVLWVASTIVLSCMSIIITAYYAYKAYRLVNTNVQKKTHQGKSIQKQFNNGILAQTITIGVLSNIPSLVLFTCIALGIDGTYLGTMFMLPMSYVSAVGAMLTLYCMRGYRRWLLQKLHLRRKGEVGQSSSNFDTKTTKY
ncbi:unnamed protein product [Bursaphelenchus xylophilus]|uniref:(pine wood nematode) hypothetical protein n=1 Tax=Bursaphelenchus xylophilus TaxID=6326 RepID=A0A1I7RZS1_BURXY|nr:unnamed protein product [Bursaphelenchus xylophilus]CAG9111660.1 unnamed protein product [Bursaphelenchus xylophilus]